LGFVEDDYPVRRRCRPGGVFFEEPVDVLHERTDRPPGSLPPLPEPFGPVPGEGLGEDFHEWPVPGQEHPEDIPFAREVGRVDDVQAGQRLARTRDPGDEDDRLPTVRPGVLDDPPDGRRRPVQVGRARLRAGQVSDAVGRVQVPGGLDDRRRRAVGAAVPGGRVDRCGRRPVMDVEHGEEELVRVAVAGDMNRLHRVIPHCRREKQWDVSVRGDEDRNDRPGPSLGVEVPQVEGVVLDLPAVGRHHRPAAGLVLQDEHDVGREQHGVNPLGPPGHRVFEQDVPDGGIRPPPDQVGRRRPEVGDLFPPGFGRGGRLVGIPIGGVPLGQPAEHRLRVGR
jgi:hypothetical protein